MIVFDDCPICRFRIYAPCDAHRSGAGDWHSEVGRPLRQWEKERTEAFERAWEEYARTDLPPAIEELLALGDSGAPAGHLGSLPRISPERAVELMRSSRINGRPIVAPDAPYRTRGSEGKPLEGVLEYLKLVDEFDANRGSFETRDELHHAGFLVELAARWLERLARHMRSYDPAAAADTLEALLATARQGWSISAMRAHASDCWFMAGDVAAALVLAEETVFDRRVNLRRIVGDDLDEADVATIIWWANSSVTTFVRERPGQFLEFVVANCREILGTSGDASISDAVFGREDVRWSGWHFAPGGGQLDRLLEASIMFDENYRGWGTELGRRAENLFRESLGVPAVGEGWVSETALFRAVEDAFGSETAVVHHGKPDGFGLQHLDIWVPEWRIGIEFQGQQHDRPIEFFGGQAAFEANQRRDKEKRRKAKELGIRLIEVRPGFDLAALLEEIAAAKPAT